MKETYTPEEVDAIMRRAIEQSPMPGTMSRTQLEQLAAEMGVSKDALARAERDYALQAREESDQSVFRSFLVWRRAAFVRSMLIRAAVILFLFGLGFVLGDSDPDGPFVVGSLGVGLSMLISWAVYATAGGLEHSSEYLEWLDKRAVMLRKVRYLKNPRLPRLDDEDDD
jgi:hypothetical protein